MSISAQNRVWEHSRQDGTNLIALLALADWADADGICWYANDRIAQRVRREERTVTRILNKLRKSGEVFAPPEYGAGRKTLKFVTVGLTEAELVEVLIRRFGMTPIEATAHALKVLKAQARGKKPVTDDGFKGDKSAKKGVIRDGFIAKKPVTDDGFKGDISRKKGDISRKKPDIAVSPDPYDPYDPSDDPEEDPPTPRGGVHVLSQLDPERPFDNRLLAIAEVCGLRENIPKHREWCEQAASQLHTFSGDYIRARYGEQPPPDEGWHWYSDDWRGQRGDMPSPPQLVETIVKRKATATRPAPSGNSRSHSRAEEVAAEYAQKRQEFFSDG